MNGINGPISGQSGIQTSQVPMTQFPALLPLTIGESNLSKDNRGSPVNGLEKVTNGSNVPPVDKIISGKNLGTSPGGGESSQGNDLLKQFTSLAISNSTPTPSAGTSDSYQGPTGGDERSGGIGPGSNESPSPLAGVQAGGLLNLQPIVLSNQRQQPGQSNGVTQPIMESNSIPQHSGKVAGANPMEPVQNIILRQPTQYVESDTQLGVTDVVPTPGYDQTIPVDKNAYFVAVFNDGYTFRNLVEYLRGTNTQGHFKFSRDYITYCSQ